jgi:hypothetical protein
MITDSIPNKQTEKQEYNRSSDMSTIALPPQEPLLNMARELEEAMAEENKAEMQVACNAIATYISESFLIVPPKVRVLGVRPRKGTGYNVEELYADYDLETHKIRLWMRTAVLEKVTSYGTFLSTLCHEICHHLDVVAFDFPNTYHTRGFYERAGILYHHVRGTPLRVLVWDRMRDGRLRINWPATMRNPGSGGRRR